MRKVLIIGILALLSLLIVGCGSEITEDRTTGNEITGNVISDNSGYVNIPLSEISKTARFYTYDDSGVKIKYFAVLGSDGRPRTAFDACDVCGGYKGYQQRGSDIVCRNCGRVFKIDGLGTQNKGYGCWPGYLPHEIKDDNVLIKISDIESGSKRFA